MNSKNGAILGALIVGAALLMTTRTSAESGKYVCPYGDGLSFDTLAELQTHVQSAHPGERIPIDIGWN
jgi:hypothetical protein